MSHTSNGSVNSCRRSHENTISFRSGIWQVSPMMAARRGKLCVFDFQVRRFFRTKPKNVAFEIDFNRFETNNYPPDALETAFGQFEGKVASVIRDISRAETIPEDEEFSYVINLIAPWRCVIPRCAVPWTPPEIGCGVWSGICSLQTVIFMTANSERLGLEEFCYGQGSSFGHVRDFIRKGEYKITYDSQEHLQRELRVFEDLLRGVGARYWSLLIAAPGAPDFVTCDRPVSLVYRQTLFPLDARHALMGDKERPAPDRIILDDKGVAEVNLRLFNLADRQIYSRTADITILDGDTTLAVPISRLANNNP